MSVLITIPFAKMFCPAPLITSSLVYLKYMALLSFALLLTEKKGFEPQFIFQNYVYLLILWAARTLWF